jgi:hypothetical protein
MTKGYTNNARKIRRNSGFCRKIRVITGCLKTILAPPFLRSIPFLLSTLLFLAAPPVTTRADTEWGGTGDLREFRDQGEPIGLTAGIRMTSPDGSLTVQAILRSPGRAGNREDFNGNTGFDDASRGGRGFGPGGGGRRGGSGGGGVNIHEQINDIAPDTTTIDVQATANTAIPLQGLYFRFTLARGDFAGGHAILGAADTSGSATGTVSFASPSPAGAHLADATVSSIRITGTGNRSVELTFSSPTHIILEGPPPEGGRGRRGGRGGRDASRPAASLLIPIVTGTLNPGTPCNLAFTLKATCDPDTAPVTLTLDPAHTGPAFAGIGGNFRLQSPSDPATIAYNFQNLRVSWARVEMPLSSWQTSETADPTAGPLSEKVRQAMEMAGTLAQKKIPMIISDWSAPGWAVATGTGAGQSGGPGSARSIAPEKWPAMYKSIASYLAYLKKNYGAEPLLFSFNEADMGINVKLTPEDQESVIKGLGAAFAAEGLATKPLLGDTGNPEPRPANYLDPTIADPEAMKYVGALSFHCWTGGSDAVIARWGQIAQRFKLPLLVAEGGTDPDSYHYPAVFLEPWYALDEINLYVRCLALAEPAAILHWQLTDNYSLLSGGRNGQPLQPTQRFFNLKQLNLTPPAAPSLGITSDRPRLTAAAYGDDRDGYAIHLVNTGAARPVTLTGLPVTLKQLYPSLTDGTRQLAALAPVPVSAGTARFNLDALSFVTLTSIKP